MFKVLVAKEQLYPACFVFVLSCDAEKLSPPDTHKRTPHAEAARKDS